MKRYRCRLDTGGHNTERITGNQPWRVVLGGSISFRIALQPFDPIERERNKKIRNGVGILRVSRRLLISGSKVRVLVRPPYFSRA